MTIKNQFSILASIIITIPVLCIIYIGIHNYIRSTERLLIKEFTELKKNEGNLYTKHEWKTIKDTLLSLPLDVDAAVISNSGQVIISSIPDLPAKQMVDFTLLWHIQNTPSKKYYFQFSTIDIESCNVLLLTRISKDKRDRHPPGGILSSLLIFLFFIVLVCFILLLIIFKTISKSIITLEKQTQEIANGDLAVKINTKNENNSNEITSISESLEKMRISLLEARNQQLKFIMGISHDLRTPVAVIKGYTEALSDGIITENEELQNTYSLIGTKTDQLETMINSLIDFMKMNVSEYRQQLSRNSITSFIKDFAKDAVVTANAFNKRVITNIELNEDYFIPLDRQLVTRAFENLLSNALRYTKENDTITISAKKIDSSILFSVKDTGIGMEDEDLKQIFNLFYRGTNSRREEGMGIGLSVVKSVIDSHNWKIDVISEKDKGSCFTITIPVLQENDSKKEAL